MQNLFPLILGFIFGFKHSLEPDHLVAVTTIVSRQKHPLASLKVGLSWGIGHTLTLVVVGSILFFFKYAIPEAVEGYLEAAVGVMIIYLSIQTLVGKSNHHHHGAESHGRHSGHTHDHQEVASREDGFIRLRSLAVGAVHGLAGSGALTALVLTSVDSYVLGVLYMFLFGVGTILSMSIASLLIGLPYTVAHAKAHKIEHLLVIASGVLGVLFGVYYIAGSLGLLG